VFQEVRLLPMHFFARLEPLPGKESEFRQELLQVVDATRSESGCVTIRAFQSLREPFAIHLRITPNCPARFLRAAEMLLAHDVQGVRTREIGG
jgi:hypothetical protein